MAELDVVMARIDGVYETATLRERGSSGSQGRLLGIVTGDSYADV